MNLICNFSRTCLYLKWLSEVWKSFGLILQRSWLKMLDFWTNKLELDDLTRPGRILWIRQIMEKEILLERIKINLIQKKNYVDSYHLNLILLSLFKQRWWKSESNLTKCVFFRRSGWNVSKLNLSRILCQIWPNVCVRGADVGAGRAVRDDWWRRRRTTAPTHPYYHLLYLLFCLFHVCLQLSSFSNVGRTWRRSTTPHTL